MVSEVLEAAAMERLQKCGPARLPRRWSSISAYERLVEKGIAVERDDPNPLLRCFALRDLTGE